MAQLTTSGNPDEPHSLTAVDPVFPDEADRR